MTKSDLPLLAGLADEYMQYETSDDVPLTWCEGCGNYGIQNALKRALVLEKLGRKDVLFCYDVGCSGNGSDKIEGYTIHGLHGRVLPLAAGCKIANHKLKIIAEAGDGATFSEGVGHVVHAVRNDYPILFLHHDNQNYGLTTGQASSLTPLGCHMNASPTGVSQKPLSHLQMMLSLNPSFVARTCSVDLDHMTETFRKALNHKGFAFVEVLQTCPTYNKNTTHEWYLEHIRKIEDLKDYDPTDIWAARKLVEIEDPLHLGVLYENPREKNFLETVHSRSNKKTTLVDEVQPYDISEFLTKL